MLNLLGYMLNQPFADHSDGVRAVLPSGLRHAHPRRREEYSGTRAFVSLAPALASHTHTHSDTPFCIRLHGGGLGASENPIRDLSAARRGGARSGGHLFGIRKDPISSSNGATSSCVWCAPPGRRERGPTPLHPGGPLLGSKLFGIFDASNQGVPHSYPLSHPISFLSPIPPPSFPFPPSMPLPCHRAPPRPVPHHPIPHPIPTLPHPALYPTPYCPALSRPLSRPGLSRSIPAHPAPSRGAPPHPALSCPTLPRTAP